MDSLFEPFAVINCLRQFQEWAAGVTAWLQP